MQSKPDPTLNYIPKQWSSVSGHNKEPDGSIIISHMKRHGRQWSKPLSLKHNHCSIRCDQLPKCDKRICPAKDSICHNCHKSGFKVDQKAG